MVLNWIQAVKVDFSLDYRVPGGILRKVALQLSLGRMNQKNMKNAAEGIKILCEA